jgi:hypothetical protein
MSLLMLRSNLKFISYYIVMEEIFCCPDDLKLRRVARSEKLSEILSVRVSDMIKIGKRSKKAPRFTYQNSNIVSQLGIWKPPYHHRLCETLLGNHSEVKFLANRKTLLHDELPLRGTPDGFIFKRKRGKKGGYLRFPVEIKSSKSFRTKRRLQVRLRQKRFPLIMTSNGHTAIKKNSLWFRQIQCYMMLADSNHGYVAFLLGRFLQLVKVERDEEYQKFIYQTLLKEYQYQLLASKSPEKGCGESAPSKTAWIRTASLFGDGLKETDKNDQEVTSMNLSTFEL